MPPANHHPAGFPESCDFSFCFCDQRQASILRTAWGPAHFLVSLGLIPGSFLLLLLLQLFSNPHIMQSSLSQAHIYKKVLALLLLRSHNSY